MTDECLWVQTAESRWFSENVSTATDSLIPVAEAHGPYISDPSQTSEHAHRAWLSEAPAESGFWDGGPSPWAPQTTTKRPWEEAHPKPTSETGCGKWEEGVGGRKR